MNLIAYDLGTGGMKAALYDDSMTTLGKVFVEYPTYYPGPGLHEQRHEDWWQALAECNRRLAAAGLDPASAACVSLSGASLVALPLDDAGIPLLEQTPIWSDTRAGAECREFFKEVPEDTWYRATGNGFPASCYPLFKLMWLRRHEPEVYNKTARVLGSKDYINYRLTGVMATDPSYASGTGAYDLASGTMHDDFIAAAGLPAGLFCTPVPSHTVIGRVTAEAAAETGLCAGTPVACGGVDNACMALGAVGAAPGACYTSLGSSSWIAVNTEAPLLDTQSKPYTFAHIEQGLYTSACSIFAGGSALRWAREVLYPDLAGGAYAEMDRLAATAPAGAGGVLFNPSLAGGTSQDGSIHIRGMFAGLHLGTTRAHLIRAVLEGVALNLRLTLDEVRRQAPLGGQMLFCGGGSKSEFWMGLFASVFGMEILRTNIDQDAATLGAAAIAARAAGMWQGYGGIPALHRTEFTKQPQPADQALYEALLPAFRNLRAGAAALGDEMQALYEGGNHAKPTL